MIARAFAYDLTNDSDHRELSRASFAHLLRRASDRFGERVAIVERGEETTFAELAARAAGIADAITVAGVMPGDACAVLARSPRDAAAGFFAALAVGATGINLNELYRPRQIEFVLRHCGARALIISRDVMRTFPRPIETSAHVVILEDIAPTESIFVPRESDPKSAAQITYTSGSTGQPKGVLMSHENLWAGVRVVAGYLGLREDDRIAGLLPFSFVYGFNQLATSLYVGATLVVERSTLSQEIVATLRREKVTVLAAVPPLWKQLLGVAAFRDQPLESLRVMTNAGGRLPPSTVRELRKAQPQARLFLMYGLTEVFRSTFLPPEEVDAHPDSMGRAVPESTVYVVNERGMLTQPGEVGELLHGGPSVGIGYVGDPEATASVFRPNPFFRPGEPERVVYSGDLVRRDEEGRLYYVGRRDRMIKTMGYRVSPDEICDVIQASGLVADAAVFTEPDPQRGERIVGCVVLRGEATLDQLRRFCGIELPRYMQPVRYAVLSEIPRNASGKHDLAQLKAVAADSASTEPSV
jgi:acyl-CoA synthetase (AMP-forming)/AMP-acid ligase II